MKKSYKGNIILYKDEAVSYTHLDVYKRQDLGLQNENLLLKATDLGLSTLVMGIRDADRLREMLSISEEEIIVSVIAVGYGDATPTMPKRKEISEFVTFY